GDWGSASGGDNTAVLNTGTAGYYQYRARNGSEDSWKESSVVTIVEVESLLPDEGTEVDDGDGDPDTKSFVVCLADTGVVTVTATPNPSVSEDNLPDCWSLTGGTGSSKLSRTVDKTSLDVTTIICSCNTSSKSTKIYTIGGPIESRDNCGEPYGKYLLLANPASSSPTDNYRAKQGQPNGVTYKWEISGGSSKAHIVGSDTGSTVELKADQEGDLTVKLTYIKSDTTCESYLQTAVQKPNQSNSYRECDGWAWFCGTPPNQYMEAYRYVHDHIRDAANRPIPHAKLDEAWAGGCGLKEKDGRTDCNGNAVDTMWMFRYSYCDSQGTICSTTQYHKVAGWPTTGYFWTTAVKWYDGAPPYSCPEIELAGCGCPHCQ
ncbi:MAG: hypothetical protein J7M30_14760, partial [Deltaproteobacteria bacterium]|nr:hypothetical protein [Deltaproteobacteria bacterium]